MLLLSASCALLEEMNSRITNIFNILAILAIVTLSFCSKEMNNDVPETIIARIGDKTISKHEFIKRCEYTIRPGFLNNNTPIHKRMILNSLIAEKLIALESGDSVIAGSEDFLQGRLEQAMRLFLYEKEATQKVKIDSTELANIIQNSAREYNVSYVSVNSPEIADLVMDSLAATKKSFDEFVQSNGVDKVPSKKVSWNFNENEVLLDSLYLRKRNNGEIVGPVKISGDHYMILKIKDWTEEKVLTDDYIQKRKKDVRDNLVKRRSKELYDHFLVDVMKGKEIEFNNDIFFPLVNIMGPIYLKNRKDNENLTEKLFWGHMEKDAFPKSDRLKLQEMRNATLFTIDGKEWTVEEFSKYLRRHPLVFRNNKMKNEEFGKEFLNAIIDLVADYYVTEEAYRRGYDKINVVQREYNIWKDNLNFVFYRNAILQENGINSDVKGNVLQDIVSTMNPIVEELQKKYADQIELNYDALKDLELTRINMEVVQPKEAFPKVVPGFPVVTDLHDLNYAKPMKKDSPAKYANNR